MNYELKDKLNLTKELLEELAKKSWQEIEYLQAQITNLAESPANNNLRQLLKNLLTSYYIFTGGIETLMSEPTNTVVESIEKPKQESAVLQIEDTSGIDTIATPFVNEFTVDTENNFEYFVDFDDPIGEPLTDNDLYNS